MLLRPDMLLYGAFHNYYLNIFSPTAQLCCLVRVYCVVLYRISLCLLFQFMTIITIVIITLQMEEAFGLAALAQNLRKDSALERSGFRLSWI